MDKSVLKFISFIFSVVVYVAILFFFLYHFFEHPTPQKLKITANAVEVYVTREEQKKVIPQKKPTPKKVAHKKATGSQSPKASLPTIDELFAHTHIPKSAPDMKKLFAHVKMPKKTHKSKKSHPQREAPSRFKGKGGKKIEELFKKIHIEEPNATAKHSIKSVRGEEDPYLQKVYKILYALWMPSKLSAGSRGKVLIHIDRYGNLSYEILELSQNEMFNAELQEYLKQVSQQKFPIPEQPKEFVVYFEAKD